MQSKPEPEPLNRRTWSSYTSWTVHFAAMRNNCHHISIYSPTDFFSVYTKGNIWQYKCSQNLKQHFPTFVLYLISNNLEAAEIDFDEEFASYLMSEGHNVSILEGVLLKWGDVILIIAFCITWFQNFKFILHWDSLLRFR